ncbi:MAG: arginine repressor [Bacteroidaceae bacterium]|nr:arginine repressor [Bacteroidaceae bacterium]
MKHDKSTRLEVIKMIVTSQELATQDELLRELAKAGFPLTQATLSRDLRKLGITKGLNDEQRYVYLMPGQRRYQRVSDTHMTVHNINRMGVVSVKFTGNLCVVKTPPGHAAHVAYDIDHAELPEVVGTIAGDDTIFIALTEGADRRLLLDHISELVPRVQLTVHAD